MYRLWFYFVIWMVGDKEIYRNKTMRMMRLKINVSVTFVQDDDVNRNDIVRRNSRMYKAVDIYLTFLWY